jgi:hypothetical protein
MSISVNRGTKAVGQSVRVSALVVGAVLITGSLAACTGGERSSPFDTPAVEADRLSAKNMTFIEDSIDDPETRLIGSEGDVDFYAVEASDAVCLFVDVGTSPGDSDRDFLACGGAAGGPIAATLPGGTKATYYEYGTPEDSSAHLVLDQP